MKHLNTKEITPDAHAGTSQENTRVPASRYSGKRGKHCRDVACYVSKHVKLFVLAAILVFAASCVAKIDEGTPVAGDGERLVTLSLTTPSASPTRALSSTQEDAVHTVDVLLFKGEDFFYRAIGGQPNASNEFTVKLPSSASAYKAVVLANARSMLSAIPVAQEQTSGTTRTNLLASITQQLTLPVTGWTNSLATAGIPMWGYENDLAVNESSSNPAATIALTRMVAKIDITVDNLVTNFKLANARLYNYSEKGSIAPAASLAGSGYEATQWNGAKAIAPHLPTGAKVTGGYIEYPISASPSITSFTNEIYAYEALAGTANTVTNTCLVIGGYYEGSTTPTYYRVEFVGTDGTTFFHLLRNHKYSVAIQEVTGHGYPSANDAYINKPANIVVQITPWNDGGLDDITFDGQHYLAVDKSEIIFYASGEAKSMFAKTDFPTGWTVNANDLPTWLTITSPVLDASDIAHGLQDVKTTLTLAAALTSVAREDEFYIVAGNLRKKIIVRQLAETEFSLSITDPVTGKPLDELSFGVGDIGDGTLPAARSFLVTWLPADADCEVTLTTVAGMDPFTFNTTGSGVNPVTISPLAGGSATITIQPDPLAPGDPDRVSRLDFSVANNGQYRTAVLYLRQANDYVTLSQTTYSTNAPVPPPANISMTTNIPVGELTATVTGTGGLVTDAAIEAAGPSLRVNFATNTLTGASLQTYTVQIKHGVQVMATLTVHVSGSGWEVIDGKLVALTETPTNLIYFTENATICPTGSSQPRSPEEAMWYEDWLGYLNVHNNDKYIIDENGPYRSYYYSPEDGYTFTSAGVTWLGAPIVRTIGYRYVNGDPDFELYVVSCVFQHRILSSANTVTLQMNLYRDPTDWVTYPHGQVFYNYDLAVRFKCVVW